MEPASYNITARQGSTYSLEFTIDDDGVAWNVIGWTARMQVRPFTSSSTVLLSLTNGSGITLSSGGTVAINISGSTLSGIPAGTHAYDLELVDLSNRPYAVLEGKFLVKPETTR